MRIRAVLVVGLVLVVSAPALAAEAISVTPRTGSRGAHFTVRFRAPAATGVLGLTRRRYLISARGPIAAGCDPSGDQTVLHARAGQWIKAALLPDARGWCRGRYSGQVAELAGPACPPKRLCPKYVAVLLNLGRFSFRVR